MKTFQIALLAFATLLPLPAKGTTDKITIRGAGRAVEIKDAKLLEEFRFGPGPGNCLYVAGNCVQRTVGWIAEWVHGPVAEPEASLPRYEVSFHLTMLSNGEPGEEREYIVYFVYSPSGRQGYVYLPGPGEPHYQENVSLILRGAQWDGHWFLATDEWVTAAQAAIARSR
jgi:hypothetical protein